MDAVMLEAAAEVEGDAQHEEELNEQICNVPRHGIKVRVEGDLDWCEGGNMHNSKCAERVDDAANE